LHPFVEQDSAIGDDARVQGPLQAVKKFATPSPVMEVQAAGGTVVARTAFADNCPFFVVSVFPDT
jgi:hypothetical protein